MEWKIGEIKQVNGEWYQCVESQDGSCKHCDMNFEGKCPIPIKECTESGRSDKSYVIFKKLEQVGEPVTEKGKTFQKLIRNDSSCKGCVFNIPNKGCYKNSYIDGPCPYKEIWVEIKQNEKDMEEKKLNLKPFDIQKAREGKPVCTRDGRKARIICFDAKDTQPIIGLYEKDIDGIAREYLCSYHMDGRMYDDQDCGYDLMILPEKKEGWVNVYYDRIDGITFSKHPYPSKEEAIKNVGTMSNRVDTVKIFWKE